MGMKTKNMVAIIGNSLSGWARRLVENFEKITPNFLPLCRRLTYNVVLNQGIFGGGHVFSRIHIGVSKILKTVAPRNIHFVKHRDLDSCSKAWTPQTKSLLNDAITGLVSGIPCIPAFLKIPRPQSQSSHAQIKHQVRIYPDP